MTRWRISPKMRLVKIPAATSAAEPRRTGSALVLGWQERPVGLVLEQALEKLVFLAERLDRPAEVVHLGLEDLDLPGQIGELRRGRFRSLEPTGQRATDR